MIHLFLIAVDYLDSAFKANIVIYISQQTV